MGDTNERGIGGVFFGAWNQEEPAVDDQLNSASSTRVRFRHAGLGDAEAVARLHADSWRRHYRGAYSEAYLDGDVVADRLAVWADRLADEAGRYTLLAETDRLIGFANTYFDADPTWGALLDNLHVAADWQRQGIGTRLLQQTAHAVARRPQPTGLYLWVLEQNTAGQAFYAALGGRHVGQESVPAPDGRPTSLRGSPVGLRYAWPDLESLLGSPQT